MLKTQVNNIKTQWKSVILSYINKHTDKWNLIEMELQKMKGNLNIYPKEEDIFRCFNYFDPENTQVVILGQDPYHGENQAIGISFGVNNDTKKPPSLKNIEKVLNNDVQTTIKYSDLIYWAKQGVLMLNASLTVLQKTPGSHMKLWKHFTKYIIDHLNNTYSNIVFVAWGSFAYGKMQHINTNKNHLYVSSHPSPFSYYRNFRQFVSFKESKPFSIINTLIKNKIHW
jgi:uracil-DNA glycosylase